MCGFWSKSKLMLVKKERWNTKHFPWQQSLNDWIFFIVFVRNWWNLEYHTNLFIKHFEHSITADQSAVQGKDSKSNQKIESKNKNIKHRLKTISWCKRAMKQANSSQCKNTERKVKGEIRNLKNYKNKRVLSKI